MSDIIFPDGIAIYPKSDKAPEWVGDSLVIDKAKAIAWLNSQPEDRVRLQVATGKTGKKYLKVDTWKPQNTTPQQPVSTKTFVDEQSDLPF